MNLTFSLKHTLGLTLVIFSLMVSFAHARQEEDNTWHCNAYDGEERQWVASSAYQRTALNKAYEACKKESAKPLSCKAAKEYCDASIQGISTSPMWQCTALDQMAQPWKSSLYIHRDDAALGAKAFCHERSAMPDTCYINLLTCKNINGPSS